jgi:transcriptional regulator with XRE-family HTH domain
MPKSSPEDRDPIDVHVGARLRRRRAMLNLTQGALAERLGLSFQAIQKYESGENRLSSAKLWQLSQFLGVGVQYFFAGLAQEQHHVDPKAREEESVALRVVKPLMAFSLPIRDELIGHIRALARVLAKG